MKSNCVLAAVLLNFVLGGCAVGTDVDPNALRTAGLDASTRVGVMAYVGGAKVVSNDVIEFCSYDRETRKEVCFKRAGRYKPTVEDPNEAVGTLVAELLQDSIGVHAKPIKTTAPSGNPRKIARSEGPANDVDAILFVPIVATSHYKQATRENEMSPRYAPAQLRHEAVVYARLWHVDGTLLWEGELGQSDMPFGGYKFFEKTTSVSTHGEFLEEIRVGFDGYLGAVAGVVEQIVQDIADDTR